MKAYVLNKIGDLSYENVPVPELRKDWALIKVKAAGICSSDIPRIYERGTYHFPTIPGHEFAGEVVKVNGEKYNDIVGKRVAVFPLIPCGKCKQCKNKLYEMCENYDYIGSRRNGAFAEYVEVPVWNLIELGDNIPYEAAALMEPLSVALHAIRKADISNDSSIAIIGTGTIAIAISQILNALGYSQIGIIARNSNKKSLISRFGNVEYIIENESNTYMFDAVFECVGSEEAIEQALKYAGTGAQIILVGNPYGNINLSQNLYWKILRKQLTVKGTWNSTYDGQNESDWTTVRSMLKNNKINTRDMITQKYHQEDLIEALNVMKNHIETYCKVMTFWNED